MSRIPSYSWKLKLMDVLDIKMNLRLWNRALKKNETPRILLIAQHKNYFGRFSGAISF
jgi:hypothetical protein